MDSICLSSACINAASNILQNLAPNYQSIDPCEDFNQYVCGGFPTRFPDKKNFGAITVAANRNHELVQLLLEGEFPASSDASPDSVAIFTKLKGNYLACMDVETVQEEADTGPRAIYDHISSLFPVSSLNSTLTANDSQAVVNLQVFLNTIEVDLFAQYKTSEDLGVSAEIVPIVSPLGFNLGEPYQQLALSNSTVLEVVLKNYLPPALQNSAKQLVKRVLQLEESFLSIPTSIEDATPFPINQTSKLAPALFITNVLQALVPEDYQLNGVILITDATATISNIIQKTPKSVILAYALLRAWQVVDPISTISETDTDRWNTACDSHIDKTMPWAATKFFLEAFFEEDFASSVEAIVDDIRNTFIERLDEVDWMTAATREVAKEKARKIKSNIIYPKEFPNAINATDLLAFYADIEISPSHFNNTISYLRWHSQKTWDQLVRRKPEWPLPNDISYNINAAYMAARNQIYITAGISQAPFFDPGLPEYISYGGLGFVSGHEFTHGFDTTGHEYDDTGLLRPTWDNETLAGFGSRAECFVDQVDGYELHVDFPNAGSLAVDPSTNHTIYANGTTSLAENMADNGGIMTSYAAWSNRKDKEAGKNLKLPGLEKLTNEQLFFITAGQVWCHNNNVEGLLKGLEIDVHAPNEARIRTIAENSKGFRDAFNCKKKEPVCQLW